MKWVYITLSLIVFVYATAMALADHMGVSLRLFGIGLGGMSLAAMSYSKQVQNNRIGLVGGLLLLAGGVLFLVSFL